MKTFIFPRFSGLTDFIPATMILLVVLFVSSPAKTYYVNNTDSLASDTNPGTMEFPWLTIHKANRTVTAGDTVIVMAGTYHDWIAPHACGEDGHWIIYKSEPQYAACLDGMVPLDSAIVENAIWEQDTTYDGNVWKIKLLTGAFCEAWKDGSRMPFPYQYLCDPLEFAPGRSLVDSSGYLHVWLEDENDSPQNHDWKVTLKSGVWLLANGGPIDKYVVVDGFSVKNYGLAGISVQRNHVKILNNKSFSNGRAGIGVDFCNHVIVEGNEAYENCKWTGFSQGITAFGVTGHDIRFIGNISHDNFDGDDPLHCGTDGSGFILDTSEPEGGAYFINNVAYNNKGGGFGVYQSNYGYFINNTSFNNGSKNQYTAECHVIATPLGSSNNIIFRNNIFAGKSGRPSIITIKYPYVAPPENVVFDHNLYYQPNVDPKDRIFEVTVSMAQGDSTEKLNLEEFQNFAFPCDTGATAMHWGDHSIVGSPDLIDWRNGGFKIGKNSLAIDAGDSSNAPPIDFYGTPRPQGAGYDIGAYEYVDETGLENANIPDKPDHLIYPNPFNGQIRIRYSLPQKSNVSLLIYDLLGRKVVKIIDGEVGPGKHVAKWEAHNSNHSHIASGVYLILFKTDFSTFMRKIVYLK